MNIFNSLKKAWTRLWWKSPNGSGITPDSVLLLRSLYHYNLRLSDRNFQKILMDALGRENLSLDGIVMDHPVMHNERTLQFSFGKISNTRYEFASINATIASQLRWAKAVYYNEYSNAFVELARDYNIDVGSVVKRNSAGKSFTRVFFTTRYLCLEFDVMHVALYSDMHALDRRETDA